MIVTLITRFAFLHAMYVCFFFSRKIKILEWNKSQNGRREISRIAKKIDNFFRFFNSYYSRFLIVPCRGCN